MTSSQSSQSLADSQGALLAAVTEVAENSLFTFADASDEAAFDAAADASGAEDGWLRAGIQFAGSTSGQFALTVPVALARRLCAAFAGAETGDDIGDDDLEDFTGELANMVCGTWLTRARRHEAFNLTPPRVRRDGGSRSTRVDNRDADRVYLTIDDTPVRLEIDWDTLASTDSPAVSERADAR